MRSTGICTVAILMILYAHVVHAASLLKQTSFPETTAYLTFSQNVALQSAGYEPWEAEYDSAGRCISGCTYRNLTIQDDLKNIENNTINARRDLATYGYTFPAFSAPASGTTQAQTPNRPQQIIVQNAPRCTPVQPDVPAGQTVPLGEPLIGRPQITSAYGARIHPVTGNRSVHKGLDFSAAVGTTVFSPAIGTVESVWSDATCGNGLKIAHSNGYETVYCHLNKSLVAAGDRVGAGCAVAETGNTGRTTGPHLHYGIKYNGEYINPTDWVGRG